MSWVVGWAAGVGMPATAAGVVAIGVVAAASESGGEWEWVEEV